MWILSSHTLQVRRPRCRDPRLPQRPPSPGSCSWHQSGLSRVTFPPHRTGCLSLGVRFLAFLCMVSPKMKRDLLSLCLCNLLLLKQGGWDGARTPGAAAPEPTCQGLGLGTEGDLQDSLHLEEHSLEQVQSMVVGEVLKDIETACKLLNIAADPMDWSPGNVQKWILWTEHQYRLPQIGKSFQELSGKDLCAMSEEQFCQRSPACGDILHAHLDIWKSGGCRGGSRGGWARLCRDTGWADSEVDSSCAGQPIHLWQFLKELLLKPHNYGRFIRWLNKDKGIFKIEDSAQVARLWGIRKNRPAMNYDKLSRSIRQYYKKGIIRKPDISQRLVYQFVHPV
uniref:SAM pointed domain-containing Ets transcription factor n=1 Tax=Zonotrichia albicollis TaxID=44394 RepID=A0A8D2MRI8_ZONAL